MSITSTSAISPTVSPSGAETPIAPSEAADIVAAFAYARDNGGVLGPTRDPLVASGQSFLNRLIERDPALADSVMHADRRFIDYVQTHTASSNPRTRATLQARLHTELNQGV